MTDSMIERQAIRAALALAVASAHGHVADAIVDMRDEATQLIGLCVRENGAPDSIRQWCDDASALVERLSSEGYLPRRPALSATAAILRLRLAVARMPVPVEPSSPSVTPKQPAKKKIVRPPVRVVGNQKTILDFITNHPDIRTKNLIDELSGSLSPRTIKRCLKELSAARLIRRVEQDDRSVVYRVDTDE